MPWSFTSVSLVQIIWHFSWCILKHLFNLLWSLLELFLIDIELFNSNNGHSKGYVIDTVKHDKSWLIYIDANVKNSLSKCFSRTMKSIVFNEIWQCTLHFSSSCEIMNHKMKRSCPASNKSKLTIPNIFITFKEDQVADIKPDKLIIGAIIISTKKCSELLYLWLSFKFTEMKVEVRNGNRCPRKINRGSDYSNCFHVRTLYSLWLQFYQKDTLAMSTFPVWDLGTSHCPFSTQYTHTFIQQLNPWFQLTNMTM